MPPVAAVGRCGAFVQDGGIRRDGSDGDAPVDDGSLGDVHGEQGPRRQAGGVGADVHAVVVGKRRQRRNRPQTRAHADRRLQGRRDGDRHAEAADLPGDAQHLADAAQRCGLDHRDIAGAGAHHRQRIAGLADQLVGGDPREDPRALQGPADVRELVDGAAGLFDVIQRPAAGQGADGGDGLVGGPAAVGVDAHAREDVPLVEPGADGVDAGDVIGQRLPRFGDLDLHGRAAGVAFQQLCDDLPVRRHIDRRDGGVDFHGVDQRFRRRAPAHLERALQPPGGLLRAVLRERRPLDPAAGGVEKHDLADLHATETRAQRQSDHAGAVDELGEAGQGGRGGLAGGVAGVGAVHGPIVPCPGAWPGSPDNLGP